MAFTPDIHDRAYQFFIEEVPELLQAIEDGILMLRQDRSANVVHEVMRAAHSIKGGSASVELDAIKEISHRLETAFRALYDESVEIDLELETLLLQGYDCLQQPLNEQMETGRHDPEQSLLKAIPVLEAIEAKLGEEALSQADSFIPSSSDLGVDMVMSIFEIDVEQGIARLEEVAANPAAFPVAGELQTQAEVFTGFGELLELPGFGAIAEAITQAVTQAPERAEEILTAALVDLKIARDLVMGGDRDQGGAPSEALLAFASSGSANTAATAPAAPTEDAIDGWGEMESFSLTDAFGDDEADAFPLDMDAAALQDLLGGSALGDSALDESALGDSALDSSALAEPEETPTANTSPDVIAEAPPEATAPDTISSVNSEANAPDSGEASDFLLDDFAFPDEPIFPSDSLNTDSVGPDSVGLDSVGLDSVGPASIDATPISPEAATTDAAQSSEVANEAVSEVASEATKSVEDPWVLPTEEIPIEEVLAAVQANAPDDQKTSESVEAPVTEAAPGEVAPDEAPPIPVAEEAVPASTNFDEAEAAGNLADLFGLAPEAMSSQTPPDQEMPSPAPAGSEASEEDAVSALFGLEADNDMSPEADIFAQVEWQGDESLAEKADAADAEQSLAEPSISAVTEAMGEEAAIAHVSTPDAGAQDSASAAPAQEVPSPIEAPAAGESANIADIVPDATPYSSQEASEDLANLLNVFDLGNETKDAAVADATTAPENTARAASNVAASDAVVETPEESIPDGTFIQMEAPAETTSSAPVANLAETPAEPSLSDLMSPAVIPEDGTVIQPTEEPAVASTEAQLPAPSSEQANKPTADSGIPPIAETSLTAGIDELFDEGTFIQPEVAPGNPGNMTNAAVEVALAELQAIQPPSIPGASPVAPEATPFATVTPTNAAPSATPVTPPSPAPSTEAPAETQVSPSAEVAPIPAAPQQPVASPSLDAAVQAVEQLFEQLPANAPLPAPVATPQAVTSAAEPTKAKKKEEKKRKAAPLSGISVRVDLSVLERMNNLVGELVLNRNSLSLQNEQLQTVVGQLSKRFKNFEGILAGLREVSDQMLVKPNQPSVSPSTIPQAESSEPNSLTAGFDSLEMDRYSGLHTQLQDIFEELMQLEEGVDDIDVLLEQSTQSISQQRQGLSRLQNELMWARMLPLDNILSRFPRVLRDLAAKHGKAVDLKLDGTSVLVDKGILEKLHDPMLHLLRNAFDHGIETPEARQQQGKDERGTIAIRAFYQGNQTVIEIKDDGRGLSLEKIARRAVELGWMTREELKTIPQQVIADLIFEPGFSTASEVSELSGRGVGLDVVREQLKLLKGNVSVTSAPGEGTKFSMKLPLTLSVAKLMVCQVGPLAIALPSDAIEDLLVPEPKRIKTVANQRFLHWHDDLIPIHPMAELLDYSCPLPDATSLKNLTDATIPVPQEWAMPILIFKQGEQFFALEVNRLLMEQELVIKPFGNAAHAPEYAYGCTILGDGQMIPVFDASSLLGSLTQEASSFSGTGINIGDEPVAAAPAAPSMSSVGSTRMSKTILVVDDSTAMRRTLALSLEKAGYRILQAGDGQEALEQLRQSSTIQLVICDVEMPTMNGFEFLSQRRREPELLTIPVVMLTSRSSDKHRRLALQLNANGYFSKPYVEQEFLKSIRGILDESPAAATV